MVINDHSVFISDEEDDSDIDNMSSLNELKKKMLPRVSSSTKQQPQHHNNDTENGNLSL